MIYKFEGVPEHTGQVRPHGNTKSNKPYYRSEKSVRRDLSSALKEDSPKEAIDKVFVSRGGLLGASSAGSLPRSQQQAYNIKNQAKLKQRGEFFGSASTTGKGRDLLFTVMEQCKMTEKTDHFVQQVTCAPEPMAVLATQQQLLDLERFCCDSVQFNIMGVDPTFNLGEFSVTPIVYQHLLLLDRRSDKAPWLLGPLLVHYRKEFKNYNFFFSTLFGLQRGIEGIKAAGTDGEKSLIDALHQQFREAILLRCFRHLQVNIESHLQAEGFPATVILLFTHDIFGYTDGDSVYHEGLVDSEDEEDFDVHLSILEPSWNKREADALNKEKQGFYAWFCRYKASDFYTGALRSTRELAGLGSPPAPYYTNANESINSMLKEKTNYTKNQWPEFNQKMKDLVAQQQREVEKAIINAGRYELHPTYKILLEMSESGKWWRLNEEQKRRHLNKLNTLRVSVPPQTTHSVSTGKGKEKAAQISHTRLPISAEHAAIRLQMPKESALGIWSKAEKLLADSDNSVSKYPGGAPSDRFVLSTGGNMPHIVKLHKVKYICDDRCAHFKSLAICSHTVTAATLDGKLRDFVLAIGGNHAPDLFQLAKHGMPPGAGRKEGKLTRYRKKTQTTSRDVVASFDSVPSLIQPIPAQSMASTSINNSTSSIISLSPSVLTTSMVNPIFDTTSTVPSLSPSVPTPPMASTSVNTSFESAVSPLSPPVTAPPTASTSVNAVSGSTLPSLSLPVPTPPMTNTTPTGLPLSPTFPITPTSRSTGPPRLITPPQSSPSIYRPSALPTLIQPVFSSPPAPFRLIVLHGNISVCNGCHQRFPRKSTGGVEDPPFNLAVQHYEDRYFINPGTGLQQARKGNAYYHAYMPCIFLKWPQLTASSLVVEELVRHKLTEEHRQLLL